MTIEQARQLLDELSKKPNRTNHEEQQMKDIIKLMGGKFLVPPVRG